MSMEEDGHNCVIEAPLFYVQSMTQSIMTPLTSQDLNKFVLTAKILKYLYRSLLWVWSKFFKNGQKLIDFKD